MTNYKIKKPLLSVYMPVLNAAPYLSTAIESILNQSFSNFEFIIVDDHSTDKSWSIIKKYAKLDKRIRIYRNRINLGVSLTSNIAIAESHGKYLARMDADDISLPERFSKQAEFMETHPDLGIFGSGMRYMDESGRLLSIPPLFQGDLSIHWHSLFESPFSNPTVMIRKSILDQYYLQYDLSSVYGEDYELWSRLLPLTKGENLSDVLLYYRLHPDSITHRYRHIDIKQEMAVNVAARAVRAYLPDLHIPEQEIIELQRAIWGVSTVDKRQRAHLLPIYFKIWDEFCRKNQGNPDLSPLEREVIAWAGRMLLYPPLQPGSIERLFFLTNKNWKWPLYLLGQIPYFLSRRLR